MAVQVLELDMELTYDEVRVPVKALADGSLRIGGTRLLLETALHPIIMEGSSPERVVEMFPAGKLADMYLLKGYYLLRQKEAREFMRKDAEEWERARARVESQPGYKEHTEQVLRRWRQMGTIDDWGTACRPATKVSR